jgi:hypothetical protein
MVPMDFSCFVDWGYVPKMEMFTAIFNGHKEGLTLELPDQELGSLCQVEVKLLDEGYVSRLCNMMYNFHKGSSKPWSQDLHVLRIRDFFMCNLDVFGVEHRKYVCNIYCQVICLSALSLEPKSNGFRAHILKGLYYSYPESMQSVIDSYPSVKKYFRTHGIINKEDSVCEKLKISYLLNA